MAHSVSYSVRRSVPVATGAFSTPALPAYRVRSLGQLHGLGAFDIKSMGIFLVGGGLLAAWILWATFAGRSSAFAGLGGWKAPRRVTERRKMPTSCFLDKKNLKYPICAKGTRGRQKVSCAGAEAAYKRARQQHKPSVAKKAVRAAKRNGCGWARAH